MCHGNRLGTSDYSQLKVYISEMFFNGMRSNYQAFGDFLIGKTFADQEEHFAFTIGQIQLVFCPFIFYLFMLSQ